jgi:hypothetical protein
VVQRKKDYEERYAASGRIVKPIGERLNYPLPRGAVPFYTTEEE